jgi:hypothetical protein
MQDWDNLVRSTSEARRKQRDADGKLYGEICRYLDHRWDEEAETMDEATLPDGRKKGRKLWRGACAFSFRVHDGQVIVRTGDDETKPEEIFADLQAASGRMAVLLCEQKERAFRASLEAA